MKRTMLIISFFAVNPSVVFAASTYQAPECAACSLRVPVADATTAAWLDNYGVPNQFNTNSVTYDPGDTVGVCNTSSCATYTRSNDNQYVNGKSTPFSSSPGNPNQCQ